MTHPRMAHDGLPIRFESSAPLAVSQVLDELFTWETTAVVVFHGSTRTIRVPIGSRTDWASVPGWAMWLIDPRQGSAAALVHDYCYRVLIPAGEMTYREADLILFEALGAVRPAVKLPTRLLMWDAVRLASVAVRPGGRIGLSEDLPRMLAVTAWGAPLAAFAVPLAIPIKTLAAINQRFGDSV